MNCKKAREFMTCSVADRSETESRAYAAHLATCAGCAEADRVSTVRGTVVAARCAEAPGVPPFFAAKVMAAIAQRQSAPDGWAWIWRMAMPIVPATAALLVLVAVLSWGTTLGGLNPGTAPVAALDFNEQLETLAPADGQNIIFTSGGELNADRVLMSVLGAEEVSGDD